MQKRTLIIGSGPCAQNIAEDLLEKNVEIIIAAKDKKPVLILSTHKKQRSPEILTQTRVLECRGSVGNFTVFMEQHGQKIERNAANIVIAEEDRRESNFPLYGLSPSSRIISLSRIRGLLNSPQQADLLSKARKIVFLTGLSMESNPVIAEEIMLSAFDLQSEFKKQVYILTENLKVGGDDLEALYRRTKDAGVVYIKFSSAFPLIDQKENGKVSIVFYDEITRQQFRLTPDITVVDETIAPSKNLSELAKILKVDRDDTGFIQADNVHRMSVYTNRKGIMVAGSSRDVQSAEGNRMDASNAALSGFELLGDKVPGSENKAEINPSRCVRCLTCYRLCPYRAIQLNTKPVVVPGACEGCGICAAECPKETIDIKGLSGSDVSDKIIKPDFDKGEKAFVPFIVAFCCTRSAGRAWELSSGTEYNLPSGLNIIEVPCAGSISYDHIFSAFKKGADGVMVLTCHKGNCHSEHGNIYAHQRADRIFDFLEQMGFKKGRFVVKTIAANMAAEFSLITSEFENQIIGLGASKIKS
ncbi:MAG: hydrogenase iron-sulfur subunit [Deltaproteobacteria bacterium]|nr:hydrogenase iron-sulfur subunit [Deltaproteobacteria bacterium]